MCICPKLTIDHHNQCRLLIYDKILTIAFIFKLKFDITFAIKIKILCDCNVWNVHMINIISWFQNSFLNVWPVQNVHVWCRVALIHVDNKKNSKVCPNFYIFNQRIQWHNAILSDCKTLADFEKEVNLSIFKK